MPDGTNSGPEQVSKEPAPQPRRPNLLRSRAARVIGSTILGWTLTNTPILSPTPTKPDQFSPNQPDLTDVVKIPETSSAEWIRDMIAESGESALTIDQAKEAVPHLTNLFSQVGKRYSSEEFSRKTFAVSSGRNKDDDRYFARGRDDVFDPYANFDAPVLQSLLADYPEAVPGTDIKGNLAGAIYSMLSSGNVIGFTQEDSVFVFLRATNGVKRYSRVVDFQFNEFNDIKCVEAKPSVMFTSTVLHELGHLDTPMNFTRASQELNEIVDIVGSDPSSPLDKNGFRFETSEEMREGVYKYGSLVGLDEFAVQHIANKLSIDNGIPVVTVGINAPKDSANFQAILDQAGISIEKLAEFHRNSDIEGFLTTVARSARGVNLDSDKEALRFGLSLFAPLVKDEYAWEAPFGDFFPGVDTDYYLTNRRPNRLQAFAGCGLPKLSRLR